MGRGLKKNSSNLRKCFIYGQKKWDLSLDRSLQGGVQYICIHP